jgi:hypothetical protein
MTLSHAQDRRASRIFDNVGSSITAAAVSTTPEAFSPRVTSAITSIVSPVFLSVPDSRNVNETVDGPLALSDAGSTR